MTTKRRTTTAATPRFLEKLDAVAEAIAKLERRVMALEAVKPPEADMVVANLTDLGDRLRRMRSEFDIHRNQNSHVEGAGRGSVR